MPRLSAVDAVTPAIERTKDLLLRPFRFKAWILMGIIGWLSGEGMGGGFSFSVPIGPYGSGSPPAGSSGAPGFPFPTGLFAIFLVAIFLFFLVVGAAFLYLFCRFRFVLFEAVLSRHVAIEPGWKKFSQPAHRFFWFGLIALLLGLLLLAVLIGVPVLIAFKRGVFGRGMPSPEVLFSVFGIALLVIVVIALTSFVLSSLAKDFLVPLMALDNLRVGQALSELWSMIKTEPLSFAGYLGMKFLLSLLLSMALIIPVIILVVFVLIGAFVVAGVVMAIPHPSTGLIVAGIVVGILLAFALIVLMFGVVLFLCAPVAAFFTSYSLYFFGGRYPKLGELMWPAPVPPPPPPAALPGAVAPA